jgi:hypothetical protein
MPLEQARSPAHWQRWRRIAQQLWPASSQGERRYLWLIRSTLKGPPGLGVHNSICINWIAISDRSKAFQNLSKPFKMVFRGLGSIEVDGWNCAAEAALHG